MKTIIFLMGLAVLLFTAVGCEEEHEHHGYYGGGGVYEGYNQSYGHGEWNEHPYNYQYPYSH
ncbi:MAG TPA: hypothetical protein VG146_02365 [Verrucomicrobiae bacterium]|nr:hypothetical protein [Verrucomicrobiae bacterium]